MRLPLATGNGAGAFWAWTAVLVALAVVAPLFLYPVFLMNALCMALFACAFNLLIGYVGLLVILYVAAKMIYDGWVHPEVGLGRLFA